MQPSREPSISIGCEAGGPEARLPCELKVGLYQALARHVTSSHCDELDEYALVLRIDGSLAQYGPEGIHRVRFAKARRYVSADIQVPEAAWRVAPAELQLYLAAQVRAALEACVRRVEKDGVAVARASLFAQVEAAIAEWVGPGGAPNNSSKPTPLRGAA